LLTAHRSPRARVTGSLGSMLLAAVALVGVPVVDPNAGTAAAASRPLAVVVVGPVEGATSTYRLEGRRIVDQLKAYGARVRFLYSPWATWAKVRESTRGANLFVYLGHGRGNPGPYGTFDAKTMNGLGLNASSGRGDRNVRFYGESFLKRSLGLASDAVVIIERAAYAAGSSEPGRTVPSARTATLRADNYATAFLAGGAAAVFSSDRSVSTVIRDLFRSRATMRSIFWNSPWTSTLYDRAFNSQRSRGATGILAPSGAGRYYQSVVGRLSLTATAWRQTWGTLPAGSGSSVRVSSIGGLLSALADDTVSGIVVANGSYRVSPAADQASNSLWIGSRFAHRTLPVTVRAETAGGVTFDGGGTGSFGGITFAAGAHDQTWAGFAFANGTPTGTGVIVFGGYQGLAAPHHITLRDVSVHDVSPSGPSGHAVYFSWAAGGPHDLLIDGLSVDSPDYGLKSALHFYHSDASNQNAWNVTVRHMRVVGTDQAIILWDSTLHDILIEDSTITGAASSAVRYEYGKAITLRRVTSTGSGGAGFYSSLGSVLPELTILDSSLN
jgi:hypothetical protein